MAVFAGKGCTEIPDAVPSDAGIAGAGVLLSSTITASVALLISGSLIFQDLTASRSSSSPPSQSRKNPSVIRRKLLNGYSDQQILVGIGLQSVGLVTANRIVPYHFFLIWMMALLSMATHNAALLTLVHDFKRDWVLRWMRQLLMLANLALSCVYGVYILQSKIKDLPDTLPIACVWAWEPEPDAGTAPRGLGGLDVVGTIVAMAGNVVIFGLATWYLQSRRQKYFRAVQVGGLVLMAGIAVGAMTRAYLLSQAFGRPDVELSDEGEKTWSFGQLLGMLMLVLPVISVIEIMRGEVSVAPPVPDDGDDREPLVVQEMVAGGKV